MKIEWVARNCPLCGSGEQSTVFAESNFEAGKLDEFAFASRKFPEYMHPRLMQCLPCDILYANPAISLDAAGTAYRDAAFDAAAESHSASLTYRKVIEHLATRFVDLSAALDIGAADGAFLEQLIALGFEKVVGIEPSAAPVAAAKPHIRELIKVAPFRSEDFEPTSFSLVTCFHVMEHVADPLALCRDALSLLKPGGAFVAVVHNWRAWSTRMLGRKSPIFDIEHFQLFSPKSAVSLLERAGFGSNASTLIWNRYPVHYWMKLTPLHHSIKRGLVAAAKKSRIGRLSVSVPAGNRAVVGFKKG